MDVLWRQVASSDLGLLYLAPAWLDLDVVDRDGWVRYYILSYKESRPLIEVGLYNSSLESMQGAVGNGEAEFETVELNPFTTYRAEVDGAVVYLIDRGEREPVLVRGYPSRFVPVFTFDEPAQVVEFAKKLIEKVAYGVK